MYLKIPISFFLVFLISTAFCQNDLPTSSSLPPSFKLKKRKLKSYKDYQGIGQTEKNLKTGIWKDVSVDGIVYRVGEYQNGIPVGLWRINYPDGTIRKTLVFDSLGSMVYWARYYQDVKIVEVSFMKGVPKYLFNRISEYEQKLFGYELMQYQTNTEHESIGNMQGYSYRAFYFDVTKVFDEMPDLLKSYNGTFKVKYWHLNGLPRTTYFFSNGTETKRIYFEFKNKKLKRKRIYYYGKLALMETYNKDGIKVKEKKYE